MKYGGLVLKCVEFVGIAEQYVCAHEEVDEMSVGVAYELLDCIVCKNIHMVEHVLKDMLQCHVAERILVYYRKTGIHGGKGNNYVMIFVNFALIKRNNAI